MPKSNLDAFLEIAGVAGESQDARLKKTGGKPIEILKFSLGGTFVGQIANKQKREKARKKGDLAAKGNTLDKFSFSVDKIADTSSVDLLQNFAKTLSKEIQPFATARVSIRKPGAKGKFFYFKLDFKEVFVTGYELTLDDDETNTPTESLDFCFSTCVMTYQVQNPDGSPGPAIPPMGWDFKLNQAISS